MAFGTDDNQDETNPPVGDPGAPSAAPATPEVPAEILKKIENQDEFIEKLKAEAKEKDEKIIEFMRKQAEKDTASATKEEIAALLESVSKPLPPAETTEPSTEKSISIDEVVGAVGDKLKQEALEVKRNENLNAALAAAKEAHGEDFNKVITAAAAAKGIDTAALNEMAMNQPAVFRELFLPKAPPKTLDTSSSTFRGGLDTSKEREVVSITGMTTKQRQAHMKQLMESLT